MHYTKVDMTTWSRAELFRFYIENIRIVMSLTTEKHMSTGTIVSLIISCDRQNRKGLYNKSQNKSGELHRILHPLPDTEDRIHTEY